MPGRAFIPGPLAQAQPRVYKSFRARQIRGLIVAAISAGIALAIFGATTMTGYLITFVAAVPGLAYGYYEPDGKPVEYWLRVLMRYYLRPQVLRVAPARAFWRRLFIYAGKVRLALAWVLRRRSTKPLTGGKHRG